MKPEYYSTTIQKALDVLNLYGRHAKLSFTEMQKLLGINKSTLFRVVSTLAFKGFLRKDESGLYELGMAMFILGNRTGVEYQLKSVALPIMKKLAANMDLTVHLGILDGLDVIIVEKAQPKRSIQMVSRVGGSVPAHCTGQGKTLLAYSLKETVEAIIKAKGMKRFTPTTITTVDGLRKELATIRKRGFAIDNSEHEKDIKCIALPILNEANELVAALSVTGLVTDYPDEQSFEKAHQATRKARDEIRKTMGYI